MSNKSKQHGHDRSQSKDRWRPHKDWRVYVGVALMLLAMFAYLATMDEALPPGGPAAQPMPASAGP
jgi:hypothetical protein